MSAEYELYLTDDAGRRIALLKKIAFMSISRSIKGYGTFHVGIPFRDFKIYPAFLPDRRVEVWRSAAIGLPMRREGTYLLRKYNIYTRQEDALEIIEFFGRSPIDILRRQSVVSSTPANYTKTDEIDDMMKEIVDENFITPPQTAPAGEFSVDGNEGLGPLISHSFYGQNVLDVLKDLHNISVTMNQIDDAEKRVFFDVVEGDPLSDGGFGYTFRTYIDIRGTDRTKGTVFSVDNGNLKDVSYYEDHLDSITMVDILSSIAPSLSGTANSSDRYLSRWNDIKIAQQSSEATTAINTAKANAVLTEGKADLSMNATLLDSPGSGRQPRSLYGVDWDLGDLIPIRYAGIDFNSEVSIVYLSVNESGKENIVGMTNPRKITPVAEIPLTLDYLIVGGGGGGGGGAGVAAGGCGGGGGGEVKYVEDYLLIAGDVYSVTVGAGGVGGTGATTVPASSAGGTGGTSIFNGISAVGGGGGAKKAEAGKNGASGGGGMYDTNPGGVASAGYAGGYGASGPPYRGGGGGGSTAVGNNGDDSSNGGSGASISIIGTAVRYAGGGGGGGYDGGDGGAGVDGGGDGSDIVAGAGAAGSANRGGGGGGASCRAAAGSGGTGGAGGSGVVILRILTTKYTGITTGAPTVTVDGLYTVMKFTASGSYTA